MPYLEMYYVDEGSGLELCILDLLRTILDTVSGKRLISREPIWDF